ncbi:hypothetical protein Amet_2923 [Alkaliphilus metalliredigens QYMF]|uniref:DUF4153 domain-containing protein n=1 Tax=Alkaliphilus metalliredigens (strain QYMF) TaxID=293826 RepID=A6TSA5_ALKMQ|nr:DUF4153 domain-containing protein [Alkaliphilus metalliredigens]ABR49073.1 hypothetical protein Amet_2923 [Alkaliphilus metalliredigens QYMF]
MNIAERMKRVTNKLDMSLKRFPITMLFGALAVAVSIFINHSSIPFGKTREIYNHIVMALSLGIPLSLCIYVLFEGRTKSEKHHRILAHVGSGLLLILYYFFFLKDMEMVTVTRYIGHSIFLYLTFTFIPYLEKKENYERYVVKLLTRFIVTYLYSVILYLGIAAILGTINLLFDAGIPGKFFFDVFLIVVGIFAPGFFLADVPVRNEEISPESYPKVLSVLLQFIILPLLSIYTLILYIYFGQILLTRELPQGLIGNLVLWYSIVSTVVLFFIYPLRKNSQWMKYFITCLPKLIIPLLGMMFVALWIRINAYGITEGRYFVLLIGLWVTCMMIYYALKRDVKNIVLAMTLAIVALATVTGPWSAYSISQISQNNRFQEILKRYDMIDQTSNIKGPDRAFVEEDKREVSAIISYFERYHSLGDIKYLPNDFQVNQMEELFGFELYDQGWGGYQNRDHFSYYFNVMGHSIDIGGFDYFIEYTTYGDQNLQELKDGYAIVYDRGEKVLEIQHLEETIYFKNIEELALEVHRQNTGTRNPTKEQMTFVDQNEVIKIQLVFKQINGFENRSIDEGSVEGMEFYVFISIMS